MLSEINVVNSASILERRFPWEACRGSDGKGLIAFNVVPTCTSCKGQVQEVCLGEGNTNVLNDSLVGFDEDGGLVRCSVGFLKSSKHLVNKLLEKFVCGTGDGGGDLGWVFDFAREKCAIRISSCFLPFIQPFCRLSKRWHSLGLGVGSIGIGVISLTSG